MTETDSDLWIPFQWLVLDLDCVCVTKVSTARTVHSLHKYCIYYAGRPVHQITMNEPASQRRSSLWNGVLRGTSPYFEGLIGIHIIESDRYEIALTIASVVCYQDSECDNS